MRYKIGKIFWWAVLAAVVLLFCYHCPFHFILGVPCMGCGMTRALIAFLTLDIEKAFYYHPLFPVVILIVLGYIAEKLQWIHFSEKWKNRIFWIVITLFIVVYVIRLVMGSEVVAFDFENSLLGKLWK